MLRTETATSPEMRAKALSGLAAYQSAPRSAEHELPPAVITRCRAMLRDYGGAGRPVVFVPSLINPPHILDLDAETSLLRWLSAQGHRCLLVDWGTPGKGDAAQDLSGHVSELLVPMLRELDGPPVLVGYCLGGTLAMAAAAMVAPRALGLIAAPWRFRGYGEGARAEMAKLWEDARPACEALGLLPMEVLQSGFWRLDPARTIQKYIAFADMAADSAAARRFVTLEDWANAGAPLTLGAGRELFEAMVGRDQPGLGRWWTGGRRVVPRAIDCPVVQFVSARDRIVPAATAARLSDTRILGAGHVGMIMGSGARAQLWEPLDQWLSALD